MTYQGPLLIKEPELRWPIVLTAAFITAVIAILVAALYYVAMPRPTVDPYDVSQLEAPLRAGDPEFEHSRHQIAVDALLGIEKVHPFNNLAVEMTGSIKNNTGRTINGLEIRGAVLDHEDAIVRDRRIVVIPNRQTVLEPDETIKVRILLENISKDSDRARLTLEVTGLRFAQS
jgi:hypothetical protein